ncbi:MAG TPA: hypothetical protein VLA88_02845 [Candidatus Saccharimonadales bacterium]|nr:hypothetical protein [Candidatus Saccharimonadales bacterium]
MTATNPNRREKWLAALTLGGVTLVLSGSVYLHYLVFRHLEEKYCAGFWESRSPGTPAWTKEWPGYCYPMGDDPIGYASLAGIIFMVGLMMAGGAIGEVILARRQKRRVVWKIVAALLVLGGIILLMWKHAFFSTAP